MSDNRDCIMSPPPPFEEATPKKQPRVSSCSSEGSKVHEFNSQEENNEITVDCPPSAFSVQEDQRKLKYLLKRINVIGGINAILAMLTFFLAFVSMGTLWVPFRIFGMPLYTILLASHALSFSCLSIVRYQVLPSLVDESNSISYGIVEQRHYLSIQPSKNELFWCYIRIFLSILINIGIWILLSYMDFQYDGEDSDETRRQIGISMILGLCLVPVSFYALFQIDPLHSELEVGERERTQGKDNSGKSVDFEMHDLSRTEAEQKMERVEGIIKVRKEVLQSNASFSQLLQEKDKILLELLQEIERLRQEKVEGNSGTGWLPSASSNI